MLIDEVHIIYLKQDLWKIWWAKIERLENNDERLILYDV